MRIIYFIFMTLSLYGQSFVRTDTANVVAHWVFDPTYSDSLHRTLANEFPLDYSNTSASYADLVSHAVLGSPVYNGGKGLPLNGIDEDLFITDAATGDAFDPGIASFTISMWFRTGSDVTSVFYLDKRTDYTGIGYGIYTSSTGQIRAIFTTAGGFAQATGAVLSQNTTYLVTASFNRSGNISLWLNTEAVATADISSLSAQNVNNSEELTLGRTAFLNANYSPITVYSVKYLNNTVVEKWHKDEIALEDGWVSNNGGGIRNNFVFFMGVASDTIYDTTQLSSGMWTITLSDSAASGVDYKILTSSDATTWTTLASGTTGTSWGSKSYSGAGTGYVAIVASGTAFFDDLVVSLSGGEKKEYNGYKGWLGY